MTKGLGEKNKKQLPRWWPYYFVENAVSSGPSDDKIEPFPEISDLESMSSEERTRLETAGFELIGEGKVGLLVLGGGQVW